MVVGNYIKETLEMILKELAVHTHFVRLELGLVYETGLKMPGHFYERSQKAGSYRAELLGLLAIYIFLAALE